jgi:hypothetical protein
MSIAPAWKCQGSVDVDVPASVAWAYMTDLRNWNDPPAAFALEGPFVEGTRGTTHMPGRPLAHWTIRHVEPARGSTIEGSFLEGTVCTIHWRFDPLSERTARLTQRIELVGENAAALVDEIRSLFEANMEPGMRRIARMMERRCSSVGGSGPDTHS